MHEFELIDHIRRAFDDGRGAGVEIGIGDDAAVLDLGGARVVLTTDAQVERVHFDRRWSTLTEIGSRCVDVNVSDLAAMGATPRALLLSIAMLPGDADASIEIVLGFAARARAFGCAVVGGNISRASELSLTVTAVGALAPGRAPIVRSGARRGDLVFVTGPIGAAALGLELLRAGHDAGPDGAAALARLRTPTARVDVGLALHGVASAAIDVSDGLVQDLGHVARASGVAIEVRLDAVPTIPQHAALAGRVGADPIALVASGGEDYELAFTAPPERRAEAMAMGAKEIGSVVSGDGVRLLDASGALLPLVRAGFEHF